MIFGPSFGLVGFLVSFCQAWMPTNLLVRWIHTDHGLKWGMPSAAVLVPSYYELGHVFQAQIENGGSAWWWLALAWALINCVKFLSVGIRSPFVWIYRTLRRTFAETIAERAAEIPSRLPATDQTSLRTVREVPLLKV